MAINIRDLFITTCRLLTILFLTLPLTGYAVAATHDHQQDSLQVQMNHVDHQSVTLLNQHHGKWQLRVKYMHMAMKDLLDGSSSISVKDVLRGFKVSPTEMDMDMTMFSLMVMITHRLHIMMMYPYIVKSMDHITRSGIEFTTESRGSGDTKIKGAYALLQTPQQRLLIRFGMSLPTGSINERDNTPTGRQQLPYPMQLGSGTFDPLFGF